MTAVDTARPLTDLIDGGATLMLGTTVENDLEFRPLTAARVERDRIDILLDTNEDWVTSFHNGDRVHLTMSDTRKNTWLSARGAGSLSTDRNLIDQLWNPFAAAYFDHGRESPGIAVLTITIDSGRYWTTTSGRIGSLISMVKATLGSPERSGEHGDITI